MDEKEILEMIEAIKALRKRAKDHAHQSRELSLAITNMDQARMWLQETIGE